MSSTSTNMNILLIPSLHMGTECIVSGCQEAFEKLGHTVIVFDSNGCVPIESFLKTQPVSLQKQQELEALAVDLISHAVLGVAESKAVDLVVSFSRAPITAQVVAALKAQGVVTAYWLIEGFEEFPYWRSAIEEHDIVATIQHEPLVSEIAQLGHVPLYLPFAAKKVCNTPVCSQTAVHDMIVVLGDASDSVCKALVPFVPRGLVVWGNGWDEYDEFAPYYQGNLDTLTNSQRKALYRDASIIVNLHSADLGQGDYINKDTFAIAACGGFQLVDKRQLMEGTFGYEHLVQFETGEELSELLTEFIDDAAARREYAVAGQQHVLENHTYLHRMQTLLNAVNEIRSTSVSDSDEIPEEIKLMMANVAEELGMPAPYSLSQLLSEIESKADVSAEAAALEFWALAN